MLKGRVAERPSAVICGVPSVDCPIASVVNALISESMVGERAYRMRRHPSAVTAELKVSDEDTAFGAIRARLWLKCASTECARGIYCMACVVWAAHGSRVRLEVSSGSMSSCSIAVVADSQTQSGADDGQVGSARRGAGGQGSVHSDPPMTNACPVDCCLAPRM